jgi:DNA-directed RNA polymerase subunit RPC12/RpoP
LSAKILTLDIETAPIVAYVWGTFDQNIGLDMIKEDWSILSFSAKWLNSDTVIFRHTGGRGINKVRDDKALLKELWKLLDEADIVVTQNGKKFDIKKINSRLYCHGFEPYSDIQIIDTLLIARGKFGFTSNKLAFLSKQRGDIHKSEHKSFPGFDLWRECLADNPKAWKEMQSYNSIDVLATEALYLEFRSWMPSHPNMALYIDSDAPKCTKCGSAHLTKDGVRFTSAGKFQRYQCQSCGSKSRSNVNLLSKAARKSLLR